MLAEAKLVKIHEIAEQACQKQGLVLYDIEYLQGSKTLRIFIDKADGNVSLDDCSSVSNYVSSELDKYDDIFSTDYNLEVSSPGIERELRKPWHFEKVKGKKIAVKLYQSLGAYFPEEAGKLQKAKSFECCLKELKNEEVLVEVNGKDFLIPLKNITKANVIFEM